MNHKVTVLLIEGKQVSQHHTFAKDLSQRRPTIVATTGRQGLDIVTNQPVDVIILNAASLRTSGIRTCMQLKKNSTAPLLLIQSNEKSDENRQAARYADVTLRLPFTIRKLINRVDGFVHAASKYVRLVAGPFELEIETCLLKTPHGEVRLSPKLMGLTMLFMRQPNIVLERSYLMEQVWQTAYMGDTRTLDVHIRWIREAIETNPSKPQYLKTVRGRGYIFDVNV